MCTVRGCFVTTGTRTPSARPWRHPGATRSRVWRTPLCSSGTDSCLREELRQPVDLLDPGVESSPLLRQVVCALTQLRHLDRSDHAQLGLAVPRVDDARRLGDLMQCAEQPAEMVATCKRLGERHAVANLGCEVRLVDLCDQRLELGRDRLELAQQCVRVLWRCLALLDDRAHLQTLTQLLELHLELASQGQCLAELHVTHLLV